MGCDIHFYVERRETPAPVEVESMASGAAPPVDTPEFEAWATGRREAGGEPAEWKLYDPRGPQPMKPCDHTVPERAVYRPGTGGSGVEPEKTYEPADCPMCEGEGEIPDYGSRAMSEWWDAAMYSGRNYRLFGILAGVRGSAMPIRGPRGIPSDVSREVLDKFESWGVDAHTPSWYSLRELVSFDWHGTFEDTTGIVSIGQYAERQRLLHLGRDEPPHSWSGGVGGADVETLNGPAEADKILRDVGIMDAEGRIEIPKPKPTADGEPSPASLAAMLAGDPAARHAGLIQQAVKEATGIDYYLPISWRESYGAMCRYFLHTTIMRMLHASGGDIDSVRCVFWFDN